MDLAFTSFTRRAATCLAAGMKISAFYTQRRQGSLPQGRCPEGAGGAAQLTMKFSS